MSDVEINSISNQDLLEHIALTIASKPLSDYINDHIFLWEQEPGLEGLVNDLRVILRFSHEYQTRILTEETE